MMHGQKRHQDMHIGFTNIILLYSDHREVSDTLVVIFRVGKCKYTKIYIVCRCHSTAGIIQYLPP